MDQTKNHWSVAFFRELIQQLVSSQVAQTFDSTKEQYGDKIAYSPTEATSYYFTFNVNRQSYNKTAKTDEAKNFNKEAFSTRTSVKPSTLPSTVIHTLPSWMVKMVRTRLSVTALVPDDYVQVWWKTFGELAQEELVTYGDQWKDVELVDGKDTIYNPTKAKGCLCKKPKKNCKRCNLPNSFGYSSWTDRCQLQFNKPTPQTVYRVKLLVLKMLLSMSFKWLIMRK